MKSIHYSLLLTLWKGFWQWATTAGIVGAAQVAALSVALLLMPIAACAPYRITHADGSVEEGWTKIEVTEADIAMWLAVAEAIRPYIEDDDASKDQKNTWDKFMDFLDKPAVQAAIENASQNTRDRIDALRASQPKN